MNLKWCLLALATGLAAGPAVAQQDFSKVEIKTEKVAGSVYMLAGSGGNIAVSAGDDGLVMVDSEFAPLAPKIKDALKKLSDKPVKILLNTHFHGDHTGGNAEFSSDTIIVAHDRVRERLVAGGNVLGNPVAPAAKAALPVLTFNERASVHLNGEDIQAIHFPHGHTDGDSMIYFSQSKVLHTGDDFVTYGFPFVDVKNGGSVSGMIAGLEKALGMLPADIKIIPGHGAVSTPDDVRKFMSMLKETRQVVSEAAKNGKTAEQMKSDHVLAKYADLGKGFVKAENWIDALYADVTANN